MLSFSACNDTDKTSIHHLLDQRDQAVSTRDVSSYSGLLMRDYIDQGKDKVNVVAQMISLFDRFDTIKMHSRDREIRVLDDLHAQCEQTYTLRVFADGDWREVVQREQIQLTKVAVGWKISGGL
ncbi:MAG: hypothetical protein R8K22_03640 [Mariprofundaceae bacterium]